MVDTAGIPSRVDPVIVVARGARDLPDRVRYDALPVSVIDGTVRATVDVRSLLTAIRVSLNVHA